MSETNQHIVIQRGGNAFEVWAPCSDDYCRTRHRLVCTSPSRSDAEGVAAALDRKAQRDE